MRITALETIRADFHDNLLWLHIETDDGLIGLGETFYAPTAVEAYLHDTLASLLLGGDATCIGAWNAQLIRQPVGYGSSGVEMRARNGNVGITSQQIEQACIPFHRIRDAVGRDMDLMVELHSRWDIESAKRIIRMLEPLEPAWFEDPIRMDNVEGLAELSRFTRIPILASETTAPKENFRRLLEQRAVGIVSFDPSWCGGISEAAKIVALADAYQVPVAPHDCTGPVGFVAGTHLSLSARNALIQETVRAYTNGWYRDVVTALPDISDGYLSPLMGPGLGLALRPEFVAHPAIRRRRSAA